MATAILHQTLSPVIKNMNHYIISKSEAGIYAIQQTIAQTKVIPAIPARPAIPAVAIGDMLPAVEAVAEVPAHDGSPAIPARPARPARAATVARPAIPATEAVAEHTVTVPAPTTAGRIRVLTQATEPTQDEMKAAFGDDALTIAKKAKGDAIFASAKAALTTIFTGLPPLLQEWLRPVEDAITAAAQAGDWTRAEAILTSAGLPADLVPAQTAMVTALAPYLTLVATLVSATTLEAVNAITVP